jgi:hypothetical protein
MKKKFATIFSSLALVAMLIATLCACSTYGSVKSKYESNGWTENEDCVKLQETLLKNALGEDYAQTCKIHALAKNGSILNYVIILEFNSTDDMNKKIDESETLKGMIKDVQNSDFVNKNCILLFSMTNEGREIFKNSK